MSKDLSKTVQLPVEFVDNLREKIGYISSTIKFWNMDKIWPTNLISDICDDIYDKLKYDTLKDFNNVSHRHINDK